MKTRVRVAAILLLIIAGYGSVTNAAESHRDSKALEVLNQMGAYTASLDRIVIKGEIFADARLDAGLMISNSSQVEISIDRPGSLTMQNFDGVTTRQVYIHQGMLTVFSSEHKFFARAEVPDDIQSAMKFAMEEFELELPLGELFFAETAVSLLTEQDTIHYITDKSRIRGVDCHHIAIRGKDIDLQLWVEEGDRPTPRKISMTMKWEGGAPRHTALMEWTSVEELDSKTFEFVEPEGAQEIRFMGSE